MKFTAHIALLTLFITVFGVSTEMGYPCIELDQHEPEVKGFIFTSQNLSEHWPKLDAFEGEDYRRVRAKAKLNVGRSDEVYVYVLRFA